jgi:hypothetical protein
VKVAVEQYVAYFNAVKQNPFNPIIVRFKPYTRLAVCAPNFTFNPIIVRFKLVVLLRSVSAESEFQSYNSSIQTKKKHDIVRRSYDSIVYYW